MTPIELRELDWSDLDLISFAWEENGRDLVLRFRVPNGRHRSVLCRWAERLEIALHHREGVGGYPMTWDASVTELPAGGYRLDFNFPSSGNIQLNCGSIEVLEE